MFSTRRPITVRRPRFDFEAVPRHWLDGRAVPTAIANGLGLLFPLGERFFLRSVRAHEAQVRDPALREAIRAFLAQEVRHGLEHERFFARLEEQGFEIRSFLAWYEATAFEGIERRAPAWLRLSTTAALEHFTAVFAVRALRGDLDGDGIDETMRSLLLWHACEEIEHKSVAFDVLGAVDGRYLRRLVGLMTGATLLVFFWLAATRHLLRQEPAGARRLDRAQFRQIRTRNALLDGALFAAALAYARPGFHPDQVDDYALAAQWLETNASRLGFGSSS
jgi:predicted metal-dependent hydrolase